MPGPGGGGGSGGGGFGGGSFGGNFGGSHNGGSFSGSHNGYHRHGTVHIGRGWRGYGYGGGCGGNLQGIAKLAEGRTLDEVESILSGIRCGMKSTSCPDQLARAIRAYKATL